jgi:hypothetical protein
VYQTAMKVLPPDSEDWAHAREQLRAVPDIIRQELTVAQEGITEDEPVARDEEHLSPAERELHAKLWKLSQAASKKLGDELLRSLRAADIAASFEQPRSTAEELQARASGADIEASHSRNTSLARHSCVEKLMCSVVFSVR